MVTDTVEERRVLRVITRLNIGGPARQALLLTRELSGEFPTVLAAGRPPEQEGELSDPDVAVNRVPLTRPLRPLQDLKAYAAVQRLIDETRPAIMHTHMAKAGAIGRIAARQQRLRPKLVHTFHGHVLDGYFSAPVQSAFVAVERRLARSTDVLIAVSEEVKNSLLGLGIGHEDKFRVVPLGLELDPFVAVTHPSNALRTRAGISRDIPLIGIVGRITSIKDHATMLEALARIPGVHLAVIGDGEDRERIRRRAIELGLASRTHFVGWIADMPGALSDLDVVALTSRNEGTPVALIEALAAGKSVVATDVGGVRSVVTHGKTGLIVPPQDPEAVAEAIVELLSDDAKRERMGAMGREEIPARFGSRNLCDTIRDLYRELTGA